MYIQQQFEETRQDVLRGLIAAHPLATLVVQGESGFVVNHIPLLLCATEGVLRGHVARANPFWHEMSESAEAVVIFQGAESYISPSWYPSKHADGKAVPTWNYAVVHVHGVPRVFDDAEWLLAHLADMTDKQESGQTLPWKISDAPADYIERLVGAVVGIEIPITRIVGKWKVSQNRPLADRLGVAEGLHARGDDRSRAMANLVMQNAGSTSANR